MESFTHDARYAVRGLRLRPGFAAMVVLTLSLGIGANVTMFSILDRLLLRAPEHIVDVDRVVQVHSRWLGSRNAQSSHPYVLYKDLLAGVSEFEQVAVTTPSGVLPVVAGLAVGIVVALLAARFVEGMLFELSPRDPTVFAAVSALLLGVAVVASLVPARRAARVDPMLALRSE